MVIAAKLELTHKKKNSNALYLTRGDYYSLTLQFADLGPANHRNKCIYFSVSVWSFSCITINFKHAKM